MGSGRRGENTRGEEGNKKGRPEEVLTVELPSREERFLEPSWAHSLLNSGQMSESITVLNCVPSFQSLFKVCISNKISEAEQGLKLLFPSQGPKKMTSLIVLECECDTTLGAVWDSTFSHLCAHKTSLVPD